MQPQRPRGPRSPSRRPGSTTASCSTARRAAAVHVVGPDGRARQVGPARQAARLARPVLQAAQQHRHQAEHRRRRRTSTSTSGSARRRSSRSTPTWSTTTGTGSGTSATATSATRASTRWTSPAGSSPAPPCRKSVISLGGRFGYNDQGETPNTQIAVLDFGDTQLIFEVRGLKTDDYHGPEGRQHRSTSRRASIAGNKFYPKGKDRAASRCRRSSAERAARARRPLRQLHRRRPQPQDRRPQRRHPRRPLLQRPVPPGQHLVPPRRAGAVQPADQGVRRQQGGLRDARAAWRSTSPRTTA